MMKNREIKSKFILEIIAIGVSIVALIISVMSYSYTVKKDKNDEKELVNIYFDSVGHDGIVLYDMAGSYHGQGTVDGMWYKVIVSNNSKHKLSIVSDAFYQKVGDSKVISGNLVEQIRDRNGDQIEFPIVMDAGESISMIYEINTTIPAAINMLLLEKYGVEAEIDYEELQQFLGENGKDIYGNTVEYTEYGDGTYMIVGEDMVYPVYGIDLITAKGNLFQGVIAR